jgi:hypothetical protein
MVRRPPLPDMVALQVQTIQNGPYFVGVGESLAELPVSNNSMVFQMQLLESEGYCGLVSTPFPER